MNILTLSPTSSPEGRLTNFQRWAGLFCVGCLLSLVEHLRDVPDYGPAWAITAENVLVDIQNFLNDEEG